MFKRLVWLWMAVMLIAGGAAIANASSESMDRHLAPDDYKMSVVKVLRTTNKAQINSYVPLVFTMRNNNPFNVIRQLRRPAQLEEGLLFTFASPEGQGGKVLYVMPEYSAESLAALVKSVDKPGLTTADGSLRIYRQLKHRRASATDPGFLTTTASFTTFNDSDFLIDPWANALYYEDAPSGSIALDNALTDWLDVPTAMATVLVKIYELDAYNDGQIGLDYISWKNGPGRNLFAVGTFSEYASLGRASNPAFIPGIDQGVAGLAQGTDPGSFAIRNNLSASGWNYTYKYEVDSSFFDFLATKGKAKVLNKVKLAMLNTWPASLSTGDQVLYYNVSSSDPSGIRDSGDPLDANSTRLLTGVTNQMVANPPTSVEEAILNLMISGQDAILNQDLNRLTIDRRELVPVETGLFIEMDNTIGTDTIVIEDLLISWTDYNSFDDSGFPQINGRHLEIEDLRLGLGDEIIIGGMKRQVGVQSTRKVPILGSLPIIGYAFGGETSQNKQTELVVSINPIEIQSYDIAQADQDVINKAVGDEEIIEPEITWGFDQYGLDKCRDYEVEAFK